MIRLISRGSWKRTQDFLEKGRTGKFYDDLNTYGQRGVAALRAATPVESGATAAGWSYGVERSSSGVTIYWTNSNVNQGAKIALLIQYGHGTGNGGYVSGLDYINPALRPIFDQIAQDVWKKVTGG